MNLSPKEQYTRAYSLIRFKNWATPFNSIWSRRSGYRRNWLNRIHDSAEQKYINAAAQSIIYRKFDDNRTISNRILEAHWRYHENWYE